MTTLSQNTKIKIIELDQQLKSMQEDALLFFSLINGHSSLHQMHAHIGRNNNRFVDSVRMQFNSPEDFIARWLSGLANKVEQKRLDIVKRRRCGHKKCTEEVLPEMLNNPVLKQYIFIFLERNFYRNFHARVMNKPNEELWQLWFGSGNLVWGLLISPARRLGEWTNDKSKMRRETYKYWTIGHVLEAGIIAPETRKPVIFQDINGFLVFYETVLARVSKSIYEREISRRYVDYVSNHRDPLNIPVLIPELRYAGKEAEHKYRLDFCILNSHTMQMLGFEISPASSHMVISGITNKNQTKLNSELAEKWSKESTKRNEYFDKYGISIITFTDLDLKDIDKCWERILESLEARGQHSLTIEQATKAVLTGYLSI